MNARKQTLTQARTRLVLEYTLSRSGRIKASNKFLPTNLEKFMVTVAKRIDAIQTGYSVNMDYQKLVLLKIKKNIKASLVRDTGVIVGRLCPVFITSDSKTFFAVKNPVDIEDLTVTNPIHYLNNVDYLDLPGVNRKVPVQTFVWKSQDSDPYHMGGIAKDVLIKILLEENKIVGSDATQSLDGERFWRSLVTGALLNYGPNKTFIYLHDIRFHKLLQLPRITHPSELDELTVWGKTPEFSKTRLLISLKPIKL